MSLLNEKSFGFEVLIAVITSVLIFFINLNENLLSTSIIRGSIAFIFFFFLTWLIKWIYFTFGQTDSTKKIGNHIELSTKMEENGEELFQEIYQIDNSSKEEDTPNFPNLDFQPIEFEKLSSDQKSIEQLVKGVKTWSHGD